MSVYLGTYLNNFYNEEEWERQSGENEEHWEQFEELRKKETDRTLVTLGSLGAELINIDIDTVNIYHIHHNSKNIKIEEPYLGGTGDVHPGEALPELGPAPGARHARPVPRHAPRDQPPPTPQLRGLRPILPRLRALIL